MVFAVRERFERAFRLRRIYEFDDRDRAVLGHEHATQRAVFLELLRYLVRGALEGDVLDEYDGFAAPYVLAD